MKQTTEDLMPLLRLHVQLHEAEKARDHWRDCFFGLLILLTGIVLYHYFPKYFPSESELEQAQAWWQ